MSSKILIVDDEPHILEFLDFTLAQEGFCVRTASKGEEAVEIFRSETFSLVITDIRMPGINGFELIKTFKEINEDAEIIVVTGFASADYAVRAMKNGGAYDFLAKPIDNIDRLLIAVRQALEKRQFNMERKSLIEALTRSNTKLKSEIEERRRAEAALRDSERKLSVMNQIDQVFLTFSGDRMYGKIVQAVTQVTGAADGCFGYLDDENSVTFPSMMTQVRDKCRISDKDTVFPFEKLGKLWRRAILEKKTVCQNKSVPVPEGHIPMSDFLLVPVVHRKQTIGLMAVANKAGDYSDNDKALLETVADHIAPILHARLARDKEEKARKLVNEELRKSEEKARGLLNATTDSIFLTDTKGIVLAINETGARRFGKKPQDLIGINTFTLYSDESADKTQEQMNTVIRSGKPVRFEDEHSGIIFDNNIYPIFNRRGKVSQLAVYGRDITKERETEIQLGAREKELEIKTANLQDANAALRALLKRREEDKTELEEKMLFNVKELVCPYLEKLKESGMNGRQTNFLDIIESNLNNIVSPFIPGLSSMHLKLTPSEIQIANLIKQGKTTKEIADMLNLSPRTIETHRDSIRKKIGLKNKKTNLRTYLMSVP